jgi:hypothetical protein
MKLSKDNLNSKAEIGRWIFLFYFYLNLKLSLEIWGKQECNIVAMFPFLKRANVFAVDKWGFMLEQFLSTNICSRYKNHKKLIIRTIDYILGNIFLLATSVVKKF